MLFFEQGINILAQSNEGKNTTKRVTLAAEQLNKRAKDIEDQYKKGKISASTVLRLAADHFNEEQVYDALKEAVDNEPLNIADAADQDPEAARVETDIDLDERVWTLEQDNDLTDIGNESMSWEAADWNTKEIPTPHKTFSAKFDDPNDVTSIICTICLFPTSQQAVVDCGHFLCKNCLDKLEYEECPMCRSPITTRKMVNFSTLTLAWKDDVDHQFGKRDSFNRNPDEPSSPKEPTEPPRTNLDDYTDHLVDRLQNGTVQEERVIRGTGEESHFC